MTLTPAYGRDYKSVKAVKDDWEAGKDFIITDLFSDYSGKPINKSNAVHAGIRSVSIRYAKLTKVTIIKF